MRLSPITRRRFQRFFANRRGTWSLVIFAALFFVSLFAELIANDRPLLVRYDGAFYFADLQATTPRPPSAATSPTKADYNDPEVAKLIDAKGWMLWPLIPYSYDTIVKDLGQPAPCAAVAGAHLLGTDDQARDVLAPADLQLPHLGAVRLPADHPELAHRHRRRRRAGLFRRPDRPLFQRFLEIWSSMPVLYLLIILASFIEPGFWSLLGIMLLFGWMALVGLVRAEFLRGRNFDYVRAARALGMLDARIMFRHILPNAMTASLTFCRSSWPARSPP